MGKTINNSKGLKFQEQKCLFLYFRVINPQKYIQAI